MKGGARALSSALPYALVAWLYCATSPFHQGLNNPNEMVRVYMTRAMVEHDTMAIDRVVGEWGGVDDKAIREGRLYSSKAPLQSLLGVPFYRLAQPLLGALGVSPTKRALTTFLRLTTAALPGLLFAFLLMRWSSRRARELGAAPELGLGVGVGLALGTMLYPYALTFTGHELAAIGGGGTYLAVMGLARRLSPDLIQGTGGMPRAALGFAALAGLLAGATPFAEYPAALVALPALAAGLWITPGLLARVRVLLAYAAGGAGPFLFGLWSHQELWGSPFKTGYAFLENRSYVELHGHGFFGVSTPKLDALGGSLFSPGTGLFFYSPVLLAGLAALLLAALRRLEPRPAELDGLGALGLRGRPLPRALAWAGLAAFVLEILFISSHQGWRGGWTLGPRYIIPVAPLLGVWVVEALVVPRARTFVAALAAASILTTGPAAALYPHLSDVFTNPLYTFVLPSYQRGEWSYGIAHALGLAGHAANLLHLLPLAAAGLFVASAGVHQDSVLRRGLAVAGASVLVVLVVALIPERDPEAAERENARLWGFWEPRNPHPQPLSPPRPSTPGLISRAQDRWLSIQAAQLDEAGLERPCVLEPSALPTACRFGDQPWQKLAPEGFAIHGEQRPLLLLHPIGGRRVRARIPAPPQARRAEVVYGLSDAAADSDNKSPVDLWVRVGGREVGRATVGNRRGLSRLPLSLTTTAARGVELEITTKDDGARVFGFDVEFFRD